MTALLVLAVWLGLSCITWGLFAAIVQGAREDEVLDLRPSVDVPSPRAVTQSVRERADSAT